MRGHVTRRSPGSWTVQVSAGLDPATGKRVRLTRTVRGSERDAQRALTAMLRDVDTGRVARAGRETFGSYLTRRWLPHMRSLGEETWQRYDSLVRVHLIPRCGRVQLAALRPHHLQSALDSMLADGAAAASVHKCYAVAAQALAQAMRWQLLATSPAAGVSPPRPRRAPLRIPTAEEVGTLLEGLCEPYRLAVLLAASTGMRRSEILRLRWASVDLEAGRLRVVAGKTDRSRRTISLPPSMVAELRRHRAEQNERRLLAGPAWKDADLVVDGGDGSPVHPDTLTHVFASTAERVKLPEVRLHDLRHAFATTLLLSGVNVKIVSEALGHASTAFTMDVYQHVLPSMGEQVAQAIEPALAASFAASSARATPDDTGPVGTTYPV